MNSLIDTLREERPRILVAGNHTKIMQSILDFDYASGREEPSIAGIISAGRRTQKLFWGDREVLIPVFPTMESAKESGIEPDFLLCITSAGSTPAMVDAFFTAFPSGKGAHLFAEGVAERDALAIIEKYGDKLIAGPSGVGLCIPGSLKLGAIGGILGERLAALGSTRGATAVICSSGGMVNELMYQVVSCGSAISFAVAFGGDRFPITSPLSWFLEAENDPQTKAVVYFGELGGRDEYDIAQAITDGRITKPVYAYIAGRFESKDEKIQFGHAKALAKAEDETAQAKMDVLRAAGVHVAPSFAEFMESFASLPKDVTRRTGAREWTLRAPSARITPFSAKKYAPSEGSSSFTEGILRRILGRDAVSRETVVFADTIFTELIDHGPHVSGAVNTMVTARAGRDMGTSVASGLLTIGPRFGGAINDAAAVWLQGVSRGTSPADLVATYSKERAYIPGIGHKKYSIYKPDPRVATLISRGQKDLGEAARHLSFASSVAHETSKKRANLILNIDGAISALFLDYLAVKEGFSQAELAELLEIEFFNSLFIIPRVAGFVGHYLDQKRIDEGLFRFNDGDILEF